MTGPRRCVRHRKDGQQCGLNASKGATVCWKHGANAPQIRKNAIVRAEIESWRLGESTDDPGETLLRLLTQSRIRADRYADELEALVAESPNLRDALVGETWVATEHGETYKAGEYIRGLAQLEAIERDRCANFARIALAAGLAERTVRIAERQGELVAALLRSAFAAAELSPDQEERAYAAVRRLSITG